MLDYTLEKIVKGVTTWYTFDREEDLLESMKRGYIRGIIKEVKSLISIEKTLSLEQNGVSLVKRSRKISVGEALELDILPREGD